MLQVFVYCCTITAADPKAFSESQTVGRPRGAGALSGSRVSKTNKYNTMPPAFSLKKKLLYAHVEKKVILDVG